MSRKLIVPALFAVAALPACSLSGTVTPVPPAVTDTPSAVPTVVVTETPIPAPALPVLPSPALLHVDFQNARSGWAIADGAIARTVDGGTTWYDATPAGLTGIGYGTRLFALDQDRVWALAPNPDFYSGNMYRTSDGGLTWTASAVPFGQAWVQFLDMNTGRVLADRGAGAGSNAVEAFQSADGGATWTSVFHNDPSLPGSSDALPLGGIKNGMTFLDAATGWVTGTRPVDGEVYLFVTHDGGASWTEQPVPLPPGYETYQYMPEAPIFFGFDGFLPLTIYLPAGGFWQTFYVNHDGGASWIGDPTDANRIVSNPGRYSFVDALHGWAWDGGANLSITSDGAQVWGGSTPSLDLSDDLTQVEFAAGPGSGFTGWVLAGLDASGGSPFYRTSDGGFNWTPLLP